VATAAASGDERQPLIALRDKLAEAIIHVFPSRLCRRNKRCPGAVAVSTIGEDWPILAHAPAELPLTIGSHTISVCDRGDAVCDYHSDSGKVTPAAVAIHTSYAHSTNGEYAWTASVYQLLGPNPRATSTTTAVEWFD
jgi:hypothetical protein